MLFPAHRAKFAVGRQTRVNAWFLLRAHIVLHHAPTLGIIEAFNHQTYVREIGFHVQFGQLDRVILKLHIVEIQKLHLQSGSLVFAHHLLHEPLRGQIVGFNSVEIDHSQVVLEITGQEQRMRDKRATATEEYFHFNHGWTRIRNHRRMRSHSSRACLKFRISPARSFVMRR